MKEKNPTVEELKSLFLASFNAAESENLELQSRIRQALGHQKPTNDPVASLINSKTMGWIAERLAQSLKKGQRDTPLISDQDFTRFMIDQVKEITGANDNNLMPKEIEAFKIFMEAAFKNISEHAIGLTLQGNNEYDRCWRWVNTVLDLADERGIRPIDLFDIRAAKDEITRRMLTKQQFVEACEQRTGKFLDVNVLKKLIYQPLLDMLAHGDAEEHAELEKMLEEEILPQLHATIEGSKVVIADWLAEEVARIYQTN